MEDSICGFIDKPIFTFSAKVLKENLQRAFYYLIFPSFRHVLSKIKHEFAESNVLLEPVHSMMIERLKQAKNQMADGYTLYEILKKGLYKKLLQSKNGQQYSFIQNCKHVVDSLITSGWIQVLLALCENCYLEAALDSLKKPLLLSIFVSSGRNKQFVPISHHEYIPDKNLHFFKVKMLYKAQFPFSWNFHTWFVKQIQAGCSWWSEPVSNLERVMNSSGEPFSLLNNCEERECAMYTKDVIRGMFHRYISVQANDDIPNIAKGIIFWIGIIMEKKRSKVNIPLIEVTLYQMKDVIESYLQLLSLCDTQIRSSIEQLFNGKYSPLVQLIKVTLKLSEYFLWHPSQTDNKDNIPRKIHLACDALQSIASFLHQQCSKEGEYQEFLSVYRQLQMKNFGLKYFWTIDCYLISSNETMNTLNLAKQGFATKDTFAQIINSIIESHSLSVSLMRKIIYFIRDSLHIVQQMEPLDEQTTQLMFQNVIGYIICRIEELPRENSVNVLVLQALELFLAKVKEIDPTFLEKYGCRNASLNRVYERMLMNQKNLDCKIVPNPNPNSIKKIEAITKLKIQLTEYINFLCRSETTGELSAYETFKSTLDKISEALSYFKSNKAQFGDVSDLYEQYLHIWFLRQCCILKGPCWTQNFFTQSEIRKKYHIFASKKQSCVFSELEPGDMCEWLGAPFSKAFADKYNYFKQKLSSANTIKSCVINAKKDLIPLFIAALSVATSSTNPDKRLNTSCVFLQYHTINYTTFVAIFLSC
ncbi:hypothetical protein RFI_39395 [Reticulomyxa filosa]|uniref:Uncharacterized protein n=1 Tax=Reticulomyxa filosa TaxID=46433 RepID=X6L9B1_RETFI|nr:hypothetical protein RFI_39395 [Reticulomyxa filosa]|eukprot:ETN98123.1 hypothetical protein RFI_39395 [Reticulomyxa filosa]